MSRLLELLTIRNRILQKEQKTSEDMERLANLDLLIRNERSKPEPEGVKK